MNRTGLQALCAGVLLVIVATVGWTTGTREVPSGTSEDALQSLLPLDGEIELGRLANGLTYYIRENSEPSNRAFLRLVVDAGSVLEREDQRGLAHFVEHMAFNGTEDFPGNEVVTFLESLGMGFGPDVNAYTTFDETVYMLEVPTDDEGKLRTGFHVLEQWAHEMTMAPEQIESERGVIMEEWRQGQGAQQRMREEQYPAIFGDSRYADRRPIGMPEVIQNAPRERLLSFYEDWYRPELMAVIAVGDFDGARVRSLIREYFAPLENPEDAPRRRSFEVPDHEETRFAPASDPEAQRTNVAIYNKREPDVLNTVGDYRELLRHSLFSQMINFRFQEITADPEAELLNAGATTTRLVRTKGVSALIGNVTNENIVPGLQRLVTEGRRIQQYGFNASELERAKSAVLSSYESSYRGRDTTNSQRFVSEYTRHFLEDEAAPGIEAEYELAQTLLPDISLADVNAIASEYLKSRNRVVLLSAVEEEGFSMPGTEALASALQEAETRTVDEWEGETATGPLMTELPEGGAITGERRWEEIDAVEWRLSNGARVIAKSTDFKSDEILLRGFAPGGSSIVSDDQHLSASFSAEIMRESGVSDFTRTELQSLLSDKTVSFNPFVGETQIGFSGSSSVDDLETLAQLIHLSMSDPRRSESAFQAWRQRMTARLQNRNQQPQAVFVDRLGQVLSNDHPRRQPITVDRLDEVSLDDAYSFYETSFTDASDFTFVVVGSFEEARLRELVQQYIATLPADPDEEQFRDIGVTHPDGVVTETVRSGIAPQSLVAIVYHGSYEWDPQTNFEIRSVARMLQTRLRETLREEQSGTYGVSASASTQREPDPRYRVNIFFGTSPERAQELAESARSVVESIRSSAPEASLVQRVKAGQRSSYETDSETNGYWVQAIRDLVWYDLPPSVVLDYPERVEALDAETLQETAREYLNPEQYVQVILMPESVEQAPGAGAGGPTGDASSAAGSPGDGSSSGGGGSSGGG